MKKLVILAVTASLIAGCGKKDDAEKDVKSAVTETTETVVKETEKAVEEVQETMERPDRDFMVENCVSLGQGNAEQCGCTIDAMEKNVSDETFQKLVNAAKDGNQDAVMMELQNDPTSMTELMAAGLEIMECNPELMQKAMEEMSKQ